MTETPITEIQVYILGRMMDGWKLRSTEGFTPHAWLADRSITRDVRIRTLHALAGNGWIKEGTFKYPIRRWEITVLGEQRVNRYRRRANTIARSHERRARKARGGL